MLGRTLLTATAVFALLPPRVLAHGGGFGAPVETRVDLPPWLLWTAGAMVVAVSFVVVAAFVTREKGARRHAATTAAGPDATGGIHAGHWVGFMAWALILGGAFFPSTQGGLAAAWFWIGVWVLVPVVQYVLGDVWRHVNPFLLLGAMADRLRGSRRPLDLPAWVGAWPATALLLLFIGLEVAAPAAQGARPLAAFLAAYTALAFFGMLYFGSAAWLERAEVLTRYFRWWAAAAPRYAGKGWSLPGAHLDGLRVERAGGAAFAVALLFGVNYDGLLATRLGRQAAAFELGGAPVGAFLVLGAGFLVFLGIYHACIMALRRSALSLDPHGELARRFAPALVPIAVGYHAAHNLFYAWENLPRLVGALADPFGLGWSVGPFAAAPDRWTLPAAYAGWFAALQVALILAGHVVAVVVAHRLAFRAFPSRLQAVRGEVPLTAVMVVYTLVGLSILGQAAAGVAG